MLLYRSVVHALLILFGANLALTVANAMHMEGVLLVLGLISTAHFLLFSLCAGAALNGQRALAIVVVVCALLIAWPPTAETIVKILVPSAAGLLLGGAIHRVLREAQRVRRSHARRVQPVPEPPDAREQHPSPYGDPRR